MSLVFGQRKNERVTKCQTRQNVKLVGCKNEGDGRNEKAISLKLRQLLFLTSEIHIAIEI
jgi:hypothetical protein